MVYAEILEDLQNMFSCCRLKIKHNIGIVFVKMGQFSDACSKFEDIMQEKPDYASGNIAIVVYVFPPIEFFCLVALILGNHLHLLLGDGFFQSLNISGDSVLQ